jgi:hypothetical protein
VKKKVISTRVKKKKVVGQCQSSFVFVQIVYMASLASRSSQPLFRAASCRAPRTASRLVAKPANAASYSLLARSAVAASAPRRTTTFEVLFFYFLAAISSSDFFDPSHTVCSRRQDARLCGQPGGRV